MATRSHGRLWAGAALAAAVMTTASAVHAQSFYAEAAKPYKGVTIRVLDEITPLQETLTKIVPDFTKETGIKVEWSCSTISRWSTRVRRTCCPAAAITTLSCCTASNPGR